MITFVSFYFWYSSFKGYSTCHLLQKGHFDHFLSIMIIKSSPKHYLLSLNSFTKNHEIVIQHSKLSQHQIQVYVCLSHLYRILSTKLSSHAHMSRYLCNLPHLSNEYWRKLVHPWITSLIRSISQGQFDLTFDERT